MTSNWPSVKLSSLCNISTGKKDANQGSLNGKYPFFTCAKDHIWSDTYSFDTKAILIAGNGQVGQSTYFEGKFEAYQRTYVLSDFRSIDERFLFLFIDGFLKSHLEALKMGNTMPYIKMGMLQDFEVPLPPLDEQKRIVAKLDEILEYVDRAVCLEESKFENFLRLLSILATTTVDKSSESKVEALSNIAEKITKGTTPTSLGHKFAESGINFVKVESISDNGGFIQERFASIDEACHADLARSQLKENDVLISIAGALGRTALVGSEILPANTNQAVALVRFGQDTKVKPEYLFSLIHSGYFDEIFNEMSAGAAQQNLSLGQLGSLLIPLISQEQQIAYIERAKSIIEFRDVLKGIHVSAIREISHLRSSILSSAFAGDF